MAFILFPATHPTPNPNPNLRSQSRSSANPNSRSHPRWRTKPVVSLEPRRGFQTSTTASLRRGCICSSSGASHSPSSSLAETLRRHSVLLLHLAASASFVIGARATPIPPSNTTATTATTTITPGDNATDSSDLSSKSVEDEELRAAFESWKSKTFALTVPLRIVALRGSMPPSWIKDFVQAQGRRLKLNCELRGSLENIFSDLSSASRKGCLQSNSAMAADLVSVGDSWLSYAISAGFIEPIQHAEDQEWFKVLHNKWKVYLCRNSKGELDSNGYIWGAPYRWGTMVIAYKMSRFRKHNLAPIEDWGDLWRPELARKISMVNSPREVVGAVLKHMGALYNTKDIDSQVIGGREAVMHNLTLLQRQVRHFDSVHYLKAFEAGDVWVAVGWSSDVIPAAKRMSDVAVVVPKSGSSLWADIWGIPSATRFSTDRIGGRVRGPSPLIHQWIEFCLQGARGLPFQQEIIPGASPSALGQLPVGEPPREPTKGRPKLDTNLVDGRPPPEILDRCEFLEPLSDKALDDYRWLISRVQKPGGGWIGSTLSYISSLFRAFGSDPPSR